MFRRARLAAIAAVAMLVVFAPAGPADTSGSFRPGAAGVGDPYYPSDGNGGYDVAHYLLNLRYDPGTDVLAGTATITARAAQNLSSFNLDLQGLTVRSITVNGHPARWGRSGNELTVTPARGLRDGRTFTAVVRYDGVPETLENTALGTSGFMHTDDGAVVAGQPHVAATWFPVNDHPIDKASYTFIVAVPAGLAAVANGVLAGTFTSGGRTTWIWQQSEPMASYLATATVGDFELNAYSANGIRFWDALDVDLLTPMAPRTGDRAAISQVADGSFKRLARTISVPAGGARLSFWINRNTEADFDFVFVEAHTVGTGDWTTLPDLNGHTSTATRRACPSWLTGVHPFLTHYQTDNGDGTCAATGSTGAWHAASGASGGFERWEVDLSGYAGTDVEVSISYASDDSLQLPGILVDDVVVTGGPGTTSFEADGDILDGWAVAGPPPGSAPNANNWVAGTAADVPSPEGATFKRSAARQPEMIQFMSGMFGPYPFRASGAIVDDSRVNRFALENQSRPVYPRSVAADFHSGNSLMVHELAHQWFGDSVSVARWKDIWLNEGFATYAQWLWREREGRGTAQELFDLLYHDVFPAGHPMWTIRVTDPGPDHQFDDAVYDRGAMTLHQLRLVVGDATFFRILRTWAAEHAGGNVTTEQFLAHAGRISGQNLDALFTAWLYTPERPVLPDTASRSAGNRTLPPDTLKPMLPGRR